MTAVLMGISMLPGVCVAATLLMQGAWMVGLVVGRTALNAASARRAARLDLGGVRQAA